jgi:uncharacterized protein (DUF1499 family)
MKYLQHLSRKAVWSQRIALVFFLLFLITFGMHRFSQINTPVAMKLFGLTIGGAVTALLLGLAALAGIWREGYKGATRATIGSLLSVLMLALPLWSLPSLLMRPRIHDITTDVVSPPAFQKITALRQANANPVIYLNAAAEQAKAYPDVQPIVVNRSAAEAFAAVRQAATALSWKVIAEEPPVIGRSGTIEATDRTMIFGFTDDVVVRVTGDQAKSRIDARSSSRYGEHDLGRNAARLRNFFTEVKTRLAAIDLDEQMKKAVHQREEVAKRQGNRKDASKQRDKNRRDVRNEAPLRTGPVAPLQITVPDQASAAGVMPPSDKTQAEATANSAAQPAPSPSEAGDEPKQTRRQRRATRRRDSGNFWEQ